jgi:hypothetical protein
MVSTRSEDCRAADIALLIAAKAKNGKPRRLHGWSPPRNPIA